MARTLLALSLCVSVSASAQTVYTWVDEDGEHYTDDPSTIPAGAKPKETKGAEVSVIRQVGPPAPERPPPSEEGKAEVAPPRAPRGPVTVELSKVKVPVDEGDRRSIEAAVAAGASSPLLAAWGGLVSSVRVEVVPAAELAECAFGQAFGRDLVKLRSPKETVHWGFALPYERTMVHELAHLLEHQRAGQARPRWFAEGFANTVAGFAGTASAEDVAWWTIARGGERPLSVVFPKARGDVAYAVATAAVGYLLELVGKDGLLQMFALRAAGATFEAAFAKVAGFSVKDFEARFVERQRPLFHERAVPLRP